MQLTDKIWNRACEIGMATEPGDHALAEMVRFHSLAMNGGVLHSIERRSGTGQIVAAAAGYRFFGLSEAADFIQNAAERWGEAEGGIDEQDQLEIEFNEAYELLVPDDRVLLASFELRFASDPGQFANLD